MSLAAAPILFGVLWLGTAQAACPALESALQAEVELGVAAYERFDWPSFQRHLDAARADVLCVGSVLSPLTSARLHLLEALAAGLSRDEAAALAAFRGLLSVMPSYQPSDGLIAPGSMLAKALANARALGDGPTRSLPGEGWTVDGRAGASGYPTERFAVVQRQESWGVLRTWVLDGGAPPPDLLAAISGGAGRLPPSASAPRDRSPFPVRTVSALGLGLASTASFLLVARPVHQRWEEDPAQIDDADRALNHAGVIGGYALGAAAGGLFLAAAITGEW